MAVSNPTAYAQMYFYERESLLPIYAHIMSGLLSDAWKSTLKLASPAGMKQVSCGNSTTRLISAFADSLQAGVNRIEIVSKSNRPPIHGFRFTFFNSPLNVDWASIGEFDAKKYKGQELKLMRSFQSREDYVRINRIKRDYVFIFIEAAYGERTGVPNGSKLVKDFTPLISAVGEVRQKDYIGFLDATPVLPASDVVGGLPKSSPRIDAQFDKPHLVVFGPRARVEEYAADIKALPSKVKFQKLTMGAVATVFFDDVSQLEKLDLPKWHAISV